MIVQDNQHEKHINQKKVMVLNKSMMPIGLVSIKRAIKLVSTCYSGTDQPKARIIDPDTWQHYNWADWRKLMPKEGEDVLLTAGKANRAPILIVLTRFNKLRPHNVSFSRKMLWRRDDYQCQYCGCRNGEMTIDHIMPKSKGGVTNWENCCLACVKCNAKKAARTMKEAGMKFFHPNFKPSKPRHNFFRNDIIKCKTWKELFENAYWNVELQN